MDERSRDVSKEAYPQYEEERELLKKRRGEESINHHSLLGVGISGGGVRSATFALGLFQALAGESRKGEKGLLEEIDFLSTVSGGGYFGGFYGSLFLPARQPLASAPANDGRGEDSAMEGGRTAPASQTHLTTSQSPADVRSQAGEASVGGALLGQDGHQAWHAVKARLAPDSEQMRYLRENGAYLAPAGPGDLLLGAAVLARNWVALMTVTVSMIIGLGLSLDLGTFGLYGLWDDFREVAARWIAWGAQHGVLLSPVFLLSAGLAVAWLVPIGWSYFLSGSSVLLPHESSSSMKRKFIWAGALLVQLAGVVGAVLLHDAGHRLSAYSLAIIVTMTMAARTRGDYLGVCPVKTHPRGARSQSETKISFVVLACVAAALAVCGIIAAYGPAFWPAGPWWDPNEWVEGKRGRLFYWIGLVCGIVAADVLLQLSAWALARGREEAKTLRSDDSIGASVVSQPDQASADDEKGSSRSRKGEANSEDEEWGIDVDQYVRHRLSVWLKNGMIGFALLALIGTVHTLARTIYAHSLEGVEGLMSAIMALGAALATGARRLVVERGRGPDGKRPGWLLSVAQYVGGFGALLILVMVGMVLAQVIFFQAKGPIVPRHTDCGSGSAVASPCLDIREPGAVESRWVYARLAERSAPEASKQQDEEAQAPWLPALEVGAVSEKAASHYPGSPGNRLDELRRGARHTLLGLVIFLLAVGALRRFLNNSTHLALYSARITRAFLGASNVLRVPRVTRSQRGIPPAAPKKVATHLIVGDDVPLGEYFRWPASEEKSSDPYSLGAPLHLINVTINETIDGRSKTQQADRRGVGMTIGPCGLSVGVRHHAVFRWDQTPAQAEGKAGSVCVYPRAPDPLDEDSPYQVFGANHDRLPEEAQGRWADDVRSRREGEFPGERLSLGRWLGISGAAFTTGLGSRTNVGLSLLLGLSNVRLGHWWWSGVRPEFRCSLLFGWVFWVQQYLLRELFARFSGTSDRLWYLSDGGHFENMGGYELLRRRLEKIVIIDGEADPQRTFEGLGNLVRKARLDFGAEIEFLEDEELRPLIGVRGRGVGTLNQLKPNEEGWSGACAALARVKYPGLSNTGPSEGAERVPPRTGWLLYIKPSLLGAEPSDVLQYRSEYPAFPHQTTGDQFFDEAQWESYRRLGEVIGRRVFRGGSFPFSPRSQLKLSSS